jgi:predicted metalloendopeptidase
MHRSRLAGALLLLAGFLLFACSPAEPPPTEPPAEEATGLSPEEIASEVTASMDTSADPCQDFYRYACGGWLDANEIPADKTRWVRSFSVIQERNQEAIREMLEDAAANPGEPGTDRHRVGAFYGSCMAEDAIDAAGTAPLEPLLERAAAVSDTASLMRVTGELHRASVGPLFGVWVAPDFRNPETNIAIFMQGGLGLPDRDYYLSEDPTKQELLAEYEQHIAHMMGLFGTEDAAATEQAAEIVAFETALAGFSRPRQDLRLPEKLYNKIDLEGLQELTPELPWKPYLEGVASPDVTQINVATPEFFEGLQKLVLETDTDTLAAYLRWHVINDYAPVLNQEIVTADFAFTGQKLEGQQEMEPRWKRCVQLTEDALGEPLGKVYVERFFPGDSKDVALSMIHEIETAFENNLPELAWMDDATRERAKEKVRAVKNKIGYPDEWRDYSGLEVTSDDFFANVLAGNRFDSDFEAAKIGQPVDPNEWGMYPQMVNAYYNPLGNEMAFPAGILQPPFFHRDFPAAMNYGAMGAVMGHELSHGFDDQGRKFAPDGELREWWEPEVSERFEERASCVADFYSQYEVEPGQNVNGRLTLGENIADIAGVKQAHSAYMDWLATQETAPEPAVPGLTNEQLFFVAYSQVWCGLVTPEQARLRLTTDPHSPPRFRILGPLSSSPAFAEAFSCPAGSPMVPEDRCEVW